jgi:hypothetical protein
VPLSFLFLLGGEGLLGGLGLGGALLELVHASCRIDELLLARVKGMADVADAYNNGVAGGACLDHIAAGATDFRFRIFRMNVRSHKRTIILARKSPMTRGNLWQAATVNCDLPVAPLAILPEGMRHGWRIKGQLDVH